MVVHELVPGRNLVEPRERDARVRRQVHRVPGLVAEPAAHDHDGADDDGDQQRGADRGRDHPGIDAAAEHRRDLLGQRDLVHQGVPPDDQHDMSQHEVEAGMTVAPVPDREAVEADQPLEPGDPREQHDLHQCRVGGQQAGQPAEAREQVAGA